MTSDLDVFSHMRKAITDLRNVCGGLILKNLLERKA